MWQCGLLVAWRAGSHSWGCHRNHPGVPCIFVGTPPPTIIDGTSSQAHLLAMSSIEYKLFKGFIKADNPIQTNKSKSRLLHFVALIFPKQLPSRESHSKPQKKTLWFVFYQRITDGVWKHELQFTLCNAVCPSLSQSLGSAPCVMSVFKTPLCPE